MEKNKLDYEQALTKAVKSRFDARKGFKPQDLSDTTWALTKKDIIPKQAQAIGLDAKEDAEQLLIQFTKDENKPEGITVRQLGDKFMYIIEQEMKAWIDKYL